MEVLDEMHFNFGFITARPKSIGDAGLAFGGLASVRRRGVRHAMQASQAGQGSRRSKRDASTQ